LDITVTKNNFKILQGSLLNSEDLPLTLTEANPNTDAAGNTPKHSMLTSSASNEANKGQKPKQRKKKQKQKKTVDQYKIYVSNVPAELNDESFEQLFLKYGEIRNAYICSSKRKGKFLYGFVSFKDIESAKKAVDDQFVSFSDVKMQIKQAACRPELVSKLNKYHHSRANPDNMEEAELQQFYLTMMDQLYTQFRAQIESNMANHPYPVQNQHYPPIQPAMAPPSLEQCFGRNRPNYGKIDVTSQLLDSVRLEYIDNNHKFVNIKLNAKLNRRAPMRTPAAHYNQPAYSTIQGRPYPPHSAFRSDWQPSFGPFSY
jgi:RNA recognition motif-containing protein